jgi:hypothetical protein
MIRTAMQFQRVLSLCEFQQIYGNEEQCEEDALP